MTAPTKTNMSFNDLENWLNQRRVTEVECLVPDLTGVARGKILPREKFTEDRGMRLPQAIVGMGVTGEFPESGPYYDVVDPTDKDMQLRPDPSTVRIVPWATDPTAQVIHDCFDHTGKLVARQRAHIVGAFPGRHALVDGIQIDGGAAFHHFRQRGQTDPVARVA